MVFVPKEVASTSVSAPAASVGVRGVLLLVFILPLYVRGSIYHFHVTRRGLLSTNDQMFSN
jgi:hypothetical protein